MLETLLVSHSTGNANNSHGNKRQFINDKVKVHCNVSSNKVYNKQHRVNYMSCVVCNGKHPIYSCQKFLDLNLDSKLNLIAKYKLSKNCLRPGHTVYDCRFGPCRRCNKKHNSIIHSDEPNTSSSAVSLSANQVEPTDSPSAAHNSGSQLLVASTPLASCLTDKNGICENIDSIQLVNKSHTVMHDLSMQPVLLSTAIIEVADKHRNFHKARTLLDNGSQRCFKRRHFAND
jgi:hypothetical protein